MVGDDVALRAGHAAAHGEDRKVARLRLSRHDRLQAKDNQSGEHDGVHAIVRH